MDHDRGTVPISSFEEFIAPISSQEFLQDVLGKRPLYVRGSSTRFEYLLSWDAVNSILSHHYTDQMKLVVMKDTTRIANEKYTRRTYLAISDQWHEQLDAEALTKLCREGASLMLSSFRQMHEPTRSLSDILQARLLSDVEVFAFAGWHRSRSFGTHWDPGEIFVAQVLGTKRWRIFEPLRRYPLPEEEHLQTQTAPPAEPYWTLDLNAGDLLYVPRGWWHDVSAYDSPTLHVTFALRPPTGVDFARTLLSEVELLRANLPRHATDQERRDYIAAFQSAVMLAVQHASLEIFFTMNDAALVSRPRLEFPTSVTSSSPDATAPRGCQASTEPSVVTSWNDERREGRS